MTLLEQAKTHTQEPLAHALLERQTEIGLRKYGQTLDSNPAPLEQRIPHLAQELADALVYALWVVESAKWLPKRCVLQGVAERAAQYSGSLLDSIAFWSPSLGITDLSSHQTGRGRVAELEDENTVLKAELERYRAAEALELSSRAEARKQMQELGARADRRSGPEGAAQTKTPRRCRSVQDAGGGM